MSTETTQPAPESPTQTQPATAPATIGQPEVAPAAVEPAPAPAPAPAGPTREERIAVALAARAAGDPDAPQEVRIRSAWRDIGCSGSGPEAFRRVLYPGATEWVWPDAERLPALGCRASERRASVSCAVPIGTLVLTYSRDRYHGRGGRCSAEFALACPPDADGKVLITLDHRTLRARPVYEIQMPDGGKVECPRRDD